MYSLSAAAFDETETATIVFTYVTDTWKVTTPSTGDLSGKTLDISGTKPTAGKSTSNITISSGNISISDIKFGDYLCNTNASGKVTCEKNS